MFHEMYSGTVVVQGYSGIEVLDDYSGRTGIQE
jgi:hypothetical protein